MSDFTPFTFTTRGLRVEEVVRPFAALHILPPSLPPRPVPLDPTDVVCSLGGKGGTSRSITYDTETLTIVVPAKNYKESGRTSSKVRVENEEDPDQFVEFCRADKVSLTPKRKGGSSKQSSFGGSGSDDGTNTYSFDYPTDKSTCKSPNEPARGCGDG